MIDSKELKKLNKDLAKIGEKLIKAAMAVPNEVTRKLALGANTIRNTIITEMQTGEKSGIIYKRKSVRHQASAPGQYPAVDTGELLRSIMFDARVMEIEVGSLGGAPYAEFLELGTKKMKPRPWLDPSVEKHRQDIINAVGDGVFEVIKNSFVGV